MVKRLCLLLVLGAITLMVATSVSAEVPVRKIVVFRSGVDDSARYGAVREVGGNPLKQLGIVNATAAELTPASMAALTMRADVLRVENDSRLREDAGDKPSIVEGPRGEAQPGKDAQARPGQQDETVPWGVERIGAPKAWRESQGEGVKVAVLDSGIDLSHPDLRVAGGVNLVSPGKSYDDDRGHGTHVAGIIGARENSRGVVGVAPSVQLYAVKVLDKDGSAWASDVIAGLDWSVANRMQVANLSFSSTEHLQSIHDAIARAFEAGIVLVASAGNGGDTGNALRYPAAYPEVIAVSAIDSKGKFPSWSSSGKHIEVTAPGVDIYSTYSGAGYTTLSGTSQAAPHVTGSVALRLGDHPREKPAEVAAALKETADRLPGLSEEQQGAGLVNARKLVSER